MKEEILAFIRRKDGYVSGEEISRRFTISRAAIWKQIQGLRRDGYEIAAVPHLGYRIDASPDKLLPHEISHNLGTKIIGKHIHHFEAVRSTMDAAFELGMHAAPEGTIVCAEAQTCGRGRMGRSWSSPKSKGLYVSIIVRPKLLPNEAARLTFVSAVAVAEAIRRVTGLLCYIKWPNDLLVNDKKVGGILTEMDAETDAVRFAVVGMGINVNTSAGHLPERATSLKEEKGELVSRVELLKEILRTFEKLYVCLEKEGFGPIVEQWRGLSATLGQRVKASYGAQHIEGEALDVDSDGGLLIRNDAGLIEKIMAGDIVKTR